MAYGVSWVDTRDARDEHLAVWERNLALPVAAQRWFDWLYRDTPAGPGRLAVLQAGSPDEPPRLVGTAGYGTRAFQMGNRVLRAAVLADMAVDQEHQTAAPALTLASEVRREVLARHDLVYAYPNQHAGPLLLKVGYRKLGETRQFVLGLRHGALLKAKFGNGAGAVVGPGLDLARATLVAARAARAVLEYRLAWVTDVDEHFDRLWHEAAGDYPLIGVRDAAFVRWRFLDRPEGRLELAKLLHRRTGTLEGYAAVAREGEVAHVRDFFARRTALGPLVRLLCAGIARRGAASVSIRLCGVPPLVTCLHDLGFRERPDRRTVVAGVGASFGTPDPGFFDVDRWYLTDADEDV